MGLLTKKRKKTANCHWCDRKLKPEEFTRDHIFSKFIRQVYKPKRPQLMVAACSSCNRTRGFLSNVFEIMYRFNHNHWEDWELRGNKPNLDRFSETVNKAIRKDLENFRQRIMLLPMHYHERRLGMMEIEEIQLQAMVYGQSKMKVDILQKHLGK